MARVGAGPVAGSAQVEEGVKEEREGPCTRAGPVAAQGGKGSGSFTGQKEGEGRNEPVAIFHLAISFSFPRIN